MFFLRRRNSSSTIDIQGQQEKFIIEQSIITDNTSNYINITIYYYHNLQFIGNLFIICIIFTFFNYIICIIYTDADTLKPKRKICDNTDTYCIKIKKLEEENMQLKKLLETQREEHVQYINKQKEVFADVMKKEKEAIQKKLHTAQEKLKLVNRKTKRKDNKIESLSKLLQHLKNEGLIAKNTLDTLQEFSENIQPIVQNEISNRGKNRQGRRYSDDLKKFAFTLHYHSPRAYEYCRSACILIFLNYFLKYLNTNNKCFFYSDRKRKV